MLEKYYLNKNARLNVSREIHKEGCIDMPEARDLLPLGSFSTIQEALEEAQKHYIKVSGCFFCSKALSAV